MQGVLYGSAFVRDPGGEQPHLQADPAERRALHLDVGSPLRLQGLREPQGPGAPQHLRLVLVRHPREDGAHQPGAAGLGLQPLVADGAQEGAPARQRRIRHQRHQRVVPERAQQRVQRRHRLARRGLLPREALRVRGQRRAAQLRGRHQPGPQALEPLSKLPKRGDGLILKNILS